MNAAVQIVPHAQDPLAAAAARILEQHRNLLPDLAGVSVLLPGPDGIPALRKELLDQAEALGFHALLGPELETLDDHLARRFPLPRAELPRPTQELLLAEAVRETPGLYPDADPWLISERLLDLFEELTRHAVDPGAPGDFEDRLRLAYGVEGPAPAPLSREARLVERLWTAWREQLERLDCLDTAGARRARLAADHGDNNGPLWVIGWLPRAAPEIHWLRERLAGGHTWLILEGDACKRPGHPGEITARLLSALGQACPASDPQTPLARALDTLFDRHTGSLPERAARCAQQLDADPFTGRLSLFEAADPEQEARAVALQVRRWLIEGRRRIGVVTGDRRLARRVRALLERAGILLDDRGGWALSTTSAAAVLERWLETIEEDFACGPLLDVLKSPFTSGPDAEARLAAVHDLERNLVQREQVVRGLENYREAARRRDERQPGGAGAASGALHALLDHIDQAAVPLRELRRGRHPAARCCAALRDSLALLDVEAGWRDDEAGRRLLALLEHLQRAAAGCPVALDWDEFRGWLGRHLERQTFRPSAADGPVRLLTLEQSRLQRFDALLLAGCTEAHLPGAPPDDGYFNQAVRAELGLPTWRDTRALRLHDFRRLLEAAPRVLLTRARERDGEPLPASPWLVRLETFHRLAWGGDLREPALDALLAHPGTEVRADPRPLPDRPESRPAPAADPRRLPRSWSASSHQRLIDCPYRFFAADQLGLAAREEVREAMRADEFGELVHRVLQAFHCGVDGLPGPWEGPLDETRLARAAALMERISRRVFARAQRTHFEARAWLRRWLERVPGYLRWQAQHGRQWRVADCEQRLDRELSPGLSLRGRIDRIDRNGTRQAVIDYKTGAVPRSEDIERGEAVQLPFYALLTPETDTVIYLGMQGEKPVTRTLEGAALAGLRDQTGARLEQLTADLARGARLPAWGDEDTCNWCEYSGLCRRANWLGENGD